MRIRSWTGVTGGCGYYRVRRPFEELARHGHDIHIPADDAPQIPAAEDVIDCDILVGQRVMHQGALAEWAHRRALVRAGGGAVVYEIDDDPWSIDVENPPLADYLHPQRGDYAGEFISRSDLVTVSTPPLAERVARYNPNVVVLPNRIDAAALDLPRAERRTDRVVVGWTPSSSHLTDLRSVVDPWREFFGSRTDVELRLIGHDYRDELRLPDVRHTGWRSDLMEYYAGIDFDIGLAPLAPIEFNQSKSAIRAVEYGARGIPIVASDVGPYREFVEDGVTGWLVRSPEEWVKRLGEMADDPAMRAEMGANARKVAERWTVQEWWQDWETAYKSVLR